MRRNRGGGFGLFLLFTQLYNFGFNRIPPVTLSFIAGNVAVYLRLLGSIPRLRQACVSAHYVWYNGDWLRLVLSSFYHLDDWHLYYNMASFLWKGKSLETSMGSKMFFLVLCTFSVLTSCVLVGLDLGLAHLLDDPSYIYSCAAGFSGVIFALKVLTTYELPHGVSMVMGIFPVPMRYACWAELVLIQLIVPNASFTGHLAGILVGLMYVKGPLKPILNGIGNIAFGTSPGAAWRSGPSYTYHSSATGTRHTSQHTQRQNDVEDEELQAAIRASLQETHRYPAPQQNLPYPSHNGENDPVFQSAIAESLRRQNTRPSASSGENFESPPSYNEATSERLYPSIPRGTESATPIAPPPYDTPVNPPYPLHDTMPAPEDMRQRRLRRFQPL